MARKQSRKKQHLTTLLILLTFVAFVCVTMVTIIITQGGKFTREGIVNTGSIKLTLEPSRASIEAFLNDKEVQVQDGFVTGVAPGEYRFRIESEQFHNWEQSVTVRAGLVNDIQVKLFPLDPTLTQITSTEIDRVFFTDDGQYAYYTVTDDNLENSQKGLYKLRIESQELFFRRNQRSEKIASINDGILELLESTDLEITPALNNTKLLITGNNNEQVYVYNLNETNKEKRIVNIAKLLGFNPKNVKFFNDNNSLLVEDDGLLFELNLVNNEKTIIDYPKSRPPIYDTNTEDVFIYSAETRRVYSYANKTLTAINVPSNIIPLSTSQLAVSGDGSALLLKSNDDYYYLDLDTLKIEKAASGVSLLDFSYDGTSAIFQKDDEILALNVERILAMNDIEITNKSTGLSLIAHPRFIYNSNLLVFNDEETGKLQVTQADGSNPITIIQDEEIDNGYYAFQPEGTSLTVLIESETDVENRLSRNLYKANLSQNPLPFNL